MLFHSKSKAPRNQGALFIGLIRKFSGISVVLFAEGVVTYAEPAKKRHLGRKRTKCDSGTIDHQILDEKRRNQGAGHSYLCQDLISALINLHLAILVRKFSGISVVLLPEGVVTYVELGRKRRLGRKFTINSFPCVLRRKTADVRIQGKQREPSYPLRGDRSYGTPTWSCRSSQIPAASQRS